MRIRALSRALVVGALASLSSVPAAHAAFSYTASAALTGSDGSFSRQAGAHADLRLRVIVPRKPSPSNPGEEIPAESIRSLDVDLPPGAVGNPVGTPSCPLKNLVDPDNPASPICPRASQIGIVRVLTSPSESLDSGPVQVEVPVINVDRPPNAPALFAFNYLGNVTQIRPRVRPGDYGISAGTTNITQGVDVYGLEVDLWAVPADPSHDARRGTPNNFGYPSDDVRRPLLTNPTSCSGTPSTITFRADSWQQPGSLTSQTVDRDADGTPLTAEGCDRLPFDPSIDIAPLSHAADAPTGLDVDLRVPQDASPDGLATAHVRDVKVQLPEGMSVSPSSAAGLGACAPAQIGLGTDAATSCPDSAKIGTVEVETPLLDEPLRGDVVLATPDDNPFGSLLAVYLVAPGPGFVLKLPGRIDADTTTGRLTATFSSNPQLPFSRLHVRFRGGSQAPLATPQTCGNYTTRTEITSWARTAPVVRDSPMRIDENCSAGGFAPAITAGTTNAAAGADAPFALSLARADGSQYLSRIDATLPAGLLARIGSVAQCGASGAATGACPAASLVGSTSVLSGPGAAPLALTGRVYLTGPYDGAPFGLSIVVPTKGQAGPFDLGDVVVRARLFVDRADAHVTVRSDPLPTILRGFPLRLRRVDVAIDRPGFMFNPTSCAPASIVTTATSDRGAGVAVPAPFRALGCGDLGLDQKLALRFTGKATTDGAHPGISARLTSAGSGANLRRAEVKLPLSVALDPDNARALCTPEQRAALACPAGSIVGQATAKSVLPDPLSGPVYFVEGRRLSPTGRVIKTLPKLWIPLSADGVTIDVNASSEVDDLNRLVTTFDALPDAPFGEFDLDLAGGKNGIIVVSGKPGTCARDKTIDARFTGQNGLVRTTASDAIVEGCAPAIASRSYTARTVTLKLSGLGAGKLRLSGAGVVASSRTLRGASVASITARLTASARRTLQRRHRLALKLTARFVPARGPAKSMRSTLTLRR